MTRTNGAYGERREKTILKSLLESIGGVAAVVTPLVGLFIAISQITLTHRMRQRAEWAKKALQDEGCASRRDSLKRIERWSNGAIVAATFVPGYVIICWLAVLFSFSVFLVVLFRNADDNLLTHFRIASIGFFFITMMVITPVESLLARRRITLQFYQGETVDSPRVLEGIHWAANRITLSFSVGITSLCWIVGFRFTPLDASFPLWFVLWMLIVTVLGCLMVIAGMFGLSTRGLGRIDNYPVLHESADPRQC